MSQVEQACEEISKCFEAEAESGRKSVLMSTSESEQSLSERAAAFPPNRALIFMKHSSSDYEENEEREEREEREGRDCLLLFSVIGWREGVWPGSLASSCLYYPHTILLTINSSWLRSSVAGRAGRTHLSPQKVIT